jgi:hypothetical protein
VPIVDDRRNFPHRALRWPLVVTSTSALPNIRTQAETLVALGVHELAGWTARALLDVAEPVRDRHALFVIGSDLVSASTFASLVRVRGKRGFVVTDMSDVDAFDAVVELPQTPAYVVDGLDRGDDMLNWSPNEAFPALAGAKRTPLTLGEGLQWLLHRPDVLERGRCFMTIGSRRRLPDGSLDARTPAIWISNGTGRDGPAHRNAPKVGWCWAGNRHTWLGFASAAGRRPLGTPV